MWDSDDAAPSATPGALRLKELIPGMVICAGSDPEQDEFPDPDPLPQEEEDTGESDQGEDHKTSPGD